MSGIIDTEGRPVINEITGVSAYSAGVMQVSAGTQTASGTVSFANSNGVSFGLAAGVLTASAAGGTGGSVVFSAGAASASLGSVVFSNSNGVSFGLNGSTITASAAAGAGGVALSAGTQTVSTGTVKFADSNGVSFGFSGSNQITATVRTDYQSSGAYLTTAAQVSHSHGNPTLNLTNLTGTTASNSAGLTLSLSAAAPSAGSVNFSGGSTSSNLTQLKFVDSNGVSFGLQTGSVLTATVKTDYQSSGNYLTTAAQVSHSHGNPTLALTNLTGTTASNSAGLTLSLSAAPPSAGSVNFSGGTTSSNLTQLKFVNSNGISFGLETGSVLTATVRTDYQSSGAYLTTAAVNTHTHGSAPSITGPISVTSNSSAWSISISNYLTTAQPPGAYLTTAAQSNQVVNSMNGSTGAVSLATGSSLSSSQNGSTITFGLASNITTALQSAGAYLTTAAQSGHTHGSGPSITGPISVTSNSGAWSISISNYLTTAQPVGAYLTTARASNDAVGLNTAATQVTWTVNSGGISLNAGAYLTTAQPPGAYLTTAQPPGAYLTTAAQVSHSHGNPTLALTNLTGTTASNSAGLTLSLSAANPGVGGGVALSLSGNSTSAGAGYSNITSGTAILAGGNNITLSQDGSRITISGANLGGAQTGISGIGASNSTYTSGSVIFSAQSNITIGTSVNGGSQYVRFSVGDYLTTAQPPGAYLTTARASNDAVGLNTAATQVTWTVNSSGISLNAENYLTTAAQVSHSHSLNELLDPSVSPPGDKVFNMALNHLQFQYAGGGSFSTNATRKGLFEVDAVVNLTDGADIVHIHQSVANPTIDLLHLEAEGTAVTLLHMIAAASVAAEINAPFKFSSGSVPLILGTGQSNSVANLNANYLQGKVSSEFQSTGAYLTTAALVGHSHGNPTLALTNLTGTTASASNGLTLSLSAAASPTSYVSNVNGSSGAISLATGSSLSSSQNGSTITFGLASNITSALQSANANYLTSQSAQALSGSNASFAFQTATFGNSNGLSFYATNGSMVGSYTVPVVPAAYVSSVNGSSGAISLAVGSSLSASTNGSTITFGLASNITSALQSANANYLTIQTREAFSASGGSSTFQTLVFTNSGGITWTNTNGSIAGTVKTDYAGTGTGFTGTNISATITHNTAGLSLNLNVAGGGGVAAGVSNTGHTAGNTGIYSSGTIVLAGSNSLTLSQSSGGAGVHTIWLQPIMSALSGGAGISLSTTGSTIVIYTV